MSLQVKALCMTLYEYLSCRHLFGAARLGHLKRPGRSNRASTVGPARCTASFRIGLARHGWLPQSRPFVGAERFRGRIRRQFDWISVAHGQTPTGLEFWPASLGGRPAAAPGSRDSKLRSHHSERKAAQPLRRPRGEPESKPVGHRTGQCPLHNNGSGTQPVCGLDRQRTLKVQTQPALSGQQDNYKPGPKLCNPKKPSPGWNGLCDHAGPR